MGVAAYNRGSEVVARGIRADHDRPHDLTVIDALNARPRGARTPFGPTVIRLAQDGSGWWIMDRPGEGWSSFGYFFPTLGKLFAAFNVYVVGYGRDEWSFFYRVEPGPAPGGP